MSAPLAGGLGEADVAGRERGLVVDVEDEVDLLADQDAGAAGQHAARQVASLLDEREGRSVQGEGGRTAAVAVGQ